MATDKIRIKDIAERAGVSVGTVDRVLHERPNVSKVAREKVEKALEEMDYQPNMYASALAYNKNYDFYMILPSHENEAYWDEVEDGAKDATERRRDFGVSLHKLYYERFDTASFAKCAKDCLKEKPDGIIVVPSTLEATRQFTDKLHEKSIPFILLDSYMPDLKPLAFYGQDSFQSGYFAARMLMLIASKEKEIMLMKLLKDGKVGSKQQMNRETGFRHYMIDHFPDVKIVEVDLPWDKPEACWSDSSNSILRCITASPSTQRLISWASSFSAATVATYRSWATIWCQRMLNACATEAFPSFWLSMLSYRASPAFGHSLTA